MSGPKMLFRRDFLGYTGGHGKVWNYFNHALALGWDARVHLTAASLRDASNPWMAVPERIEPQWRPDQADMLFLAGMDWEAWPPGPGRERKPTVALVQHVRHADPALPLYRFLQRPAWRICVSQAVADAIAGTGQVQGPVQVIPAALDLPAGIPHREAGRDVFIGALKAPQLGVELAAQLRDRGCRVVLSEGWLPRSEYLAQLARAAVAVPLPHPTEGFFLPGLEAMALGCPLVMPDCRGNGEYAMDDGNCLMPAAEPGALAAAVERLLADPALAARLVVAGQETAARYSLATEREAFAALLDRLWP